MHEVTLNDLAQDGTGRGMPGENLASLKAFLQARRMEKLAARLGNVPGILEAGKALFTPVRKVIEEDIADKDKADHWKCYLSCMLGVYAHVAGEQELSVKCYEDAKTYFKRAAYMGQEPGSYRHDIKTKAAFALLSAVTSDRVEELAKDAYMSVLKERCCESLYMNANVVNAADVYDNALYAIAALKLFENRGHAGSVLSSIRSQYDPEEFVRLYPTSFMVHRDDKTGSTYLDDRGPGGPYISDNAAVAALALMLGQNAFLGRLAQGILEGSIKHDDGLYYLKDKSGNPFPEDDNAMLGILLCMIGGAKL